MKKRGNLSNGPPPDEQPTGGDPEQRPGRDFDAANELDLSVAAELGIIDAAVEGDIQAFADLFERYRPDLYGFCLRRLNDHSLSEDMVQDIFLRAVKNLSSFDRSKRVWPWLATIALRMCVDLQRHRSFTHYSGDIGVSVETGGYGQSRTFLDEAITSEEHVRLWSALDVLPKRQRRAFLLHTLEGWSYKEIASAEGISVGAVGLLISRARKKLRAIFKSSGLAPVLVPFASLRRKLSMLYSRFGSSTPALGETFPVWTSQATSASLIALLLVFTAGAPDASQPSNPRSLAQMPEVLSFLQPQSSAPPGQKANSQPLAFPAENPRRAGPILEAPDAWVESVLDPSRNETPETASFWSLAVSPNYENDSSVFAGGVCGANSESSIRSDCRVLFVSRDGGASWTRLGSRGMIGETILLPPNYGIDNRIFVLGAGVVQETTDGGDSFKVVSGPGQFGWISAVSPGFGKGDSRILLAGQALLEYWPDEGLTKPSSLPLTPLPSSFYSSIAFSPGYPADPVILVGALDYSPVSSFGRAAGYESLVHRCEGWTCQKMQLPTLRTSAPFMRLSPRFSEDGRAYVFTGDSLFSYDDGTRIFSSLQIPPRTLVQDLAVSWPASQPVMFLAVLGDSGGIYRSLDGGGTWTRTPFKSGAMRVAVTPTGRLFTAPAYGRGIACSIDGGETWRPRCPPE